MKRFNNLMESKEFSFTTLKKVSFQKFLNFSNILNSLLITSTILVLLTLMKFLKIYIPITFKSPTVNGDESKYYEDLIRALNGGLSAAIDSGASITS